MTMLPPGSTIGILGGGQLGKMLAIAAAEMGYRRHIYAPEENSVAAEVAAEFTCADYDDVAALSAFAVSAASSARAPVPAKAEKHAAANRDDRKFTFATIILSCPIVSANSLSM